MSVRLPATWAAISAASSYRVAAPAPSSLLSARKTWCRSPNLVALEKIEDEAERLAALDAYLIDTGEALSDLPHIAVSDDQAHRLKMGQSDHPARRDAPLPAPEAYATVQGQARGRS